MKRKGGFFRFILLVIDLALAVWIFSAYQKARAGDPKETAAHTTQAATRPAQTTPAATTQAPTKPAPTTQAPTTPVPTTNAPSVPARSAEEMERFSWYLDGVITAGVPAGSTQITRIQELFGQWKALLYCDPEGENARMIFADVILDAGQSSYLAAYDDYLTYSLRDGKETAKTNLETPAYPFTLENGLAAADLGDQTVYLYFYEYDGSQYASGAFLSSAGEAVFIALTR
ncbi:MAG: hypothetical protein J5493_07905 [Lachnospiraceae bacterium]|nr:hypothetical protein [Lachnospiraceae bacterium]